MNFAMTHSISFENEKFLNFLRNKLQVRDFKHNHAREFTEIAENPYFSREAVL